MWTVYRKEKRQKALAMMQIQYILAPLPLCTDRSSESIAVVVVVVELVVVSIVITHAFIHATQSERESGEVNIGLAGTAESGFYVKIIPA